MTSSLKLCLAILQSLGSLLRQCIGEIFQSDAKLTNVSFLGIRFNFEPPLIIEHLRLAT